MSTLTTTIEKERGSGASLSSRLGKTVFVKFLERIEDGQLIVHDGQNVMTFGSKSRLSARITVLDQRFYAKVVLGGSVGAGEAYIDRYWDTSDLVSVIRIIARNVDRLNRFEKRYGWIFQPYHLLMHRRNSNSRTGARRNISSHYDLGNDLYKSFLDSSMMYSSAIYPSQSSDLEQASTFKLERICKRLDLQPGDHLIEIGSGWGGFAIHAAANYGCQVTTTTISEAQHREAKQRIEAAGLGDRIKLLNQDYRDLTGTYDKLVSIEMIEAVGHQYLPAYFAACSRLLKKTGRMLIQAITINDQEYNRYIRSVDFIQRHVFPGGSLVSNRTMLDLIAEKTNMVVRGLHDFGLDYARTLHDWQLRFNRNFDSLEPLGYDERFRRLWNFYLAYCQGGFMERTISVVHLVADKPKHGLQEP
ncbi:MAG: cyclopropane-fatty-acyl-phospholipid synthase [Desulfofustis sp.]|jgi:cyclopropane-fatty-acyl-phospholipid synthase